MITPTEKYPDLAKALNLDVLYFKREDLHPYGSHKGRSIPAMIDHYYKTGDRNFALSSSGNASLAAALYSKTMNSKVRDEKDKISLEIFVSNNISPHKFEKLKQLAYGHMRVLTKERPLQALTQAVSEGARSLRQSNDDEALVGYESLAKELAEVKDLGAVFIGTSSGTTAQALAEYFLKNKIKAQVHIVQTSSCHPMAEAFETYEGPNEKSTADAIVDIIAQRKTKLIELIKKTGGKGWFASNEEIRTAQELTLTNTGLEISTNSALSVVGSMKAAYIGYEIKGAIVCLICGD